MNHQLIDQDMHCGNPRRRRERENGAERIFEKCLKTSVPKFIERREYKHPESLTNSKWVDLRDSHQDIIKLERQRQRI